MADGKTWCCNRKQYHPDGKYYLETNEGESRSSTNLGIKGETFKAKVNKKQVDPTSFEVQGFRGIPEHIYGNAGVRCELDKEGEPKAFYYPLSCQDGSMVWKIRELPKSFFLSEEIGSRKLMFFNQDKVGIPKRLLITEGQDDALAAAWMLSKYNIRTISVPNGANIKAFEDNYEWLCRIEDLCFDPDKDEVGEALVKKVVELFPRIKILRKSRKDACDMLANDCEGEYIDCYFRAMPYKPASIIEITESLIEEATKPVEWGLPYPFQALTERTFGYTTPCVIGIGAAPGAGKTTFVQAIQSHFVYNLGQPIGVIDLENRPGYALRKLVGFQLGIKIHTPDTPYPPEVQQAAKEVARDLMGRGVLFYDSQDEIEDSDLMAAIRYMVVTKGIRAIFIDPLSGLVAHMDASEANKYLNKVMFAMSNLTRKLDFGVFHINHLNNPHSDKDHGEGAVVRGSQFAGSRAMWKYSTSLWALEVNQQAETEEERSICQVRIIKDRLDGRTGTFKLRYNKTTGRHEELDTITDFLPPVLTPLVKKETNEPIEPIEPRDKTSEPIDQEQHVVSDEVLPSDPPSDPPRKTGGKSVSLKKRMFIEEEEDVNHLESDNTVYQDAADLFGSKDSLSGDGFEKYL